MGANEQLRRELAAQAAGIQQLLERTQNVQGKLQDAVRAACAALAPVRFCSPLAALQERRRDMLSLESKLQSERVRGRRPSPRCSGSASCPHGSARGDA